MNVTAALARDIQWQPVGDEISVDGGPRIQTLQEFFDEHAEDETVDAVIADLIPGSGNAMISGQPRDGKTLVTLECLLARATSTPAFGILEAPGPPQACWYLTDEDPIPETKKRWADMLIARGLDIGAPPPTVLVSIKEGINLDDRATQDWTINTIKQRDIRLFAIDPVRAHTGCGDAGPEKFKPFGDFLRRLSRETDAIVLLVHHDVKPGSDGKPDSRRRAQRASGGAIFSTITAPISTERIDKDRLLLVPDGFKFAADPNPIEVTFDWSCGLRLIGRRLSDKRPDDVSLEALILQYLTSAPGSKSGDIPPGVKRSRQDVFRALDQMEMAGKVKHTAVGRAKHWRVTSSV